MSRFIQLILVLLVLGGCVSLCVGVTELTSCTKSTTDRLISFSMTPDGETLSLQQGLGLKTLEMSQTSAGKLNCAFNISTYDVPQYTYGVPLGYRTPPSSRVPFYFVAVIPQSKPSVLQVWYERTTVSPTRWTLYKTVTIAGTPFADWRGVAIDKPNAEDADRILVYSSNKVVEISLKTDFLYRQELDLDGLSGSFLSNPMTRITAFGVIDRTFYITRAGNDFSQPGQIMMFQTNFGRLKYLKTIYFEHGPTRLFTWEQAWGKALYWTTQTNNTHNYLWFWDLDRHEGETVPTHIDIGSSNCYQLGPAVETQQYGQYAVLFLVPCSSGSSAQPGYAIVEIFADHLNRSISSVKVVNSDMIIRGSVPAKSSSRSGTFVTFEQNSNTLVRTMYEFAEPSKKRTVINPQVAVRPTFLPVHTEAVPPFCSMSACGPDSQTPNCPQQQQCLYYQPASNWLCCSRSPFS